MAHYALLDDNNIVTQVIVGYNEWEIIDGISDWENYYGKIYGKKCLRTSYNGNIRKNYAGIGHTYNPDLDAFIPPRPFASWLLNEKTCQWQAPISYPGDAENIYTWNEENQTWDLVQITL
jgi:hypothetical protein